MNHLRISTWGSILSGFGVGLVAAMTWQAISRGSHQCYVEPPFQTYMTGVPPGDPALPRPETWVQEYCHREEVLDVLKQSYSLCAKYNAS